MRQITDINDVRVGDRVIRGDEQFEIIKPMERYLLALLAWNDATFWRNEPPVEPGYRLIDLRKESLEKGDEFDAGDSGWVTMTSDLPVVPPLYRGMRVRRKITPKGYRCTLIYTSNIGFRTEWEDSTFEALVFRDTISGTFIPDEPGEKT